MDWRRLLRLVPPERESNNSSDIDDVSQALQLDPQLLRAIQAALHDAGDESNLLSGTSKGEDSNSAGLDQRVIRAIEEAIAHSRGRSHDPRNNVSKVPVFNPSNFENAEKIFAQAAKSFQADLSEDEAAIVMAFKTPETMVESLRNHVDHLRTPHRSRLHDAISVVEEFGHSLQPFFSIVELLVSSHPEWAAIAWGGIRLVFQLSSHYVEYFEKLAEMLAQISHKLPQYSRQYNLIRDRAERRRAITCKLEISEDEAKAWNEELEIWDPYYVSLAKSLSFVYTDVMWFCGHASQILPRHGLGKRERIKRFARRLWTPMDEHFAKVLSRLQTHQKLFEEGLAEIYSTDTIVHYNLVDKEMMAQNAHRLYTETVIARVESKLNSVQKQLDHNEAVKTELFEKETRERKAQNVRQWIAAPDWTTLFDAAEKHRAACTGNWFLQQETYRDWMSQDVPESGYDMFSEQLLFISGKPGYGKTVLSTSVIADLRRRISRSSNELGASLAFFHFNMQHGNLNSSASAFRSVLTQMLHTNKDNPIFLDLAAIIMDDIGCGQTAASEKEVKSILRVFLGHVGQSYLLFDALDECTSWEEFLESLEDITRGIRCKIIILCRPHLRLANIIGGNPTQIALEAEGNLEDMKRYLEPNIQRLWDRGKISKSLSVAAISSKIAHRANSMFLWAVLMAGYLASPLLTPNDRLEAINNLKMLEGLDAIFTKVLEDLQLRIPKREWSKILKMFQWLIVAQRPWSVEMLRTALAVQRNRKTTSDDFIADFEESLLQTCGSFVEIRQDRTVGFIHLSVQEFLTISGYSSSPDGASSFHVQREVADCSMATVCLSYLTYNIPHGPLSGSENIAADRRVLDTEYPLLSYATKWWPIHASQAFPSPKSDISVYPKGCLENMCQAMTPAISNKKLMKTWIESYWTFYGPPSLGGLATIMNTFSNHCPDGYKRDVLATANKLKGLSSELTRLKDEWGHILKSEPHEIWLPSINAIGDFDLFSDTNEASLKPLTSESDENCILIASQVSSDGTKVGMLKVWPSDDLNFDAAETEDIAHEPPPWRVEYQIWSLETASAIQGIKFEIPHNQWLPATDDKGKPIKSDQFRLPVAFSASLYLIIVQGILLKVPETASTASGDNVTFQVLPAPACQHMLDYNALAMNHAMSFYPRRYSFQRAPKVMPEGHKCHTWSQYMVSPNERYLIHIIGDGPPCDTKSRRWVMSAYEDTSTDEDLPSFKLRASVGVQFRRSMSRSNKVERYMCFHPSQPIAAICKLTTVSIWHFLERDCELVQVHPNLLDDMNWSECGRYLQGTSALTGDPVFLNLASYTSSLGESNTKQIEALHKESTTTSDAITAFHQPDSSKSLSKSSTSQILAAGSPLFAASSTSTTYSSIVQFSSSSAIVLQTLDHTGTMTSHTLARLPKSETLEQSYSTLIPSTTNNTPWSINNWNNNSNAGAERLRLVLNKAAQETYSVGQKADFCLPAVFERTKESVPVVRVRKMLEIDEVIGEGV